MVQITFDSRSGTYHVEIDGEIAGSIHWSDLDPDILFQLQMERLTA